MTTYVVTDYDGCDYITAGKRYEATPTGNRFVIVNDFKDKIFIALKNSFHLSGYDWTVIEDLDTPKIWGEMTDAEKGAMLLAHHEGKVIQCLYHKCDGWVDIGDPIWAFEGRYRIKPEPVVGEAVLHGGGDYGCGNACFSDEDIECDTHTLTLPTLDGDLVTGEFANEDGMKVVIEEKQK